MSEVCEVYDVDEGPEGPEGPKEPEVEDVREKQASRRAIRGGMVSFRRGSRMNGIKRPARKT